MAPGRHPEQGLDEDEEDSDVPEMEALPDGSRIRLEIDQAMKKTEAAVKGSLPQGRDVEREIERAMQASAMSQRDVEKEVLPYCAREGIGILAWSPIGKGLLSGKYHNGRRPKDRVRSDEDLFKPANVRASAPLVRELRRIGKIHGKTPAQVALAWLRRHPYVVPIPGGKRPSQAAENAGAAGWSLGSRELRGLDAILRRTRLDTF